MAVTNEMDYTYAVARIRANELSLLGAADVEQLLSAPDSAAAESLLAAKGYAMGLGLHAALNEKAAETWRLIAEILPRREGARPGTGELDFLLVKNDFHNLKARLKAMFTGGAPEAYLMFPTVFGDGELGEALLSKRFVELPECMAGCAREAYELLAKTMDGQLADALIDRQCLETILSMARAARSEFLLGLAEKMCAFANAKIALRAERTGKGQAFLDRALCNCPPVDLPEEARRSGAALEKYCDDALIGYVSPAKGAYFGIAPLVAYVLAKEAELQTVRIVMTCRKNAVPAETIRRRVRLLYV
ncbi:MAG: V-type ATPase subunit [Firmicutes bacterium]|nr:V-type ATPase subunit [Bacillota bacterium]